MTDSQAINSSVLAEYLDVLKQMQKSLQAHAVHTEYKSTQAYLARAMDTQLYSLIPNCDALRALVVEQEQADAGDSPQFAVGDTVKIKDSWPWSNSNFLGYQVGIELTIKELVLLDFPQHENYDKKPGFRLSNGGDVAPSDLTLIKKAGE